MPLTVNLRHLENRDLTLAGELPVEDLDIQTLDETIQLEEPLEYDLEVHKLEGGLLVEGKLRLTLKCQCVRCLKPFKFRLEIEDWTSHLPFQGEDAVAVANDSVDLTPQVREDILLGFPQHPLCKTECGGLPKTYIGKAQHTNHGPNEPESSAWSELDKLKF